MSSKGSPAPMQPPRSSGPSSGIGRTGAVRAATMGVLLFSPVVLSACSAGQVTQTATQVRDKVGTHAQVGDIALRAVELAYPPSGTYQAGEDAELKLGIVNSGDTPDTL